MVVRTLWSVVRLPLTRAVAAGLWLLAAGSGLAQTPPDNLRSAADPQLQAGLERVVAQQGLRSEVELGHLALALIDATDPRQPRLAMLNGDRMMYAASLPKVAILLAALAEVETGHLELNPSMRAAMTNMIRVSSNLDATRVLRWVGVERLLEILQSPRFAFYDRNGAGGLWVGKPYGPGLAEHRDPVRGLSHGATAYQVARLYWLLAQDRLLSPAMNALMKETLSKPGIRHKFVKGLAARPDARLFRKSGSWQHYHADSALVESGGRRFVLVALAEHADGGRWLEQLALPLHDLIVPARPPLPARADSAR